ncbi:hypothetical protein CMMCAS05_00120 [Clavibacter michiganensis subsp. michiganensis]|uniref:Uncharacterized protein n=1 Tax=Clavibacter michiganensis subsp. michiganensis TaxID=33013 RepID=A0A1Y3FGM6_CLAMM|nr:hypothetical protein [Clavibacter michiganensis]OUD81059.1 hypothetical protein BC477_18610 [Clavibacter michiganensis subsp. michiganensis]OUD96100.1 hypothetical protein CMMCAS05_00120 [Clavibacter michiganensis subsp. michiganensis]OUD99876.1 hypothetical protein CMMCAS04_02100 [Clavibacter michiganensis subsp. michiganensis]OUE01496.1 hypothetical protein CMMCAS07_14395 [Clavibacter michiganensis subsp. michiganensis]OUE12652.1 hypothetical protein CMMCAY01_06575 [Clavibacter michiganen
MTATVMTDPASAARTVYAVLVCPLTGTPSTSHAYVLVVAAGVQRAVVARRRWPMTALPVMTGAGVAVNGAAAAVACSRRIIDAVVGAPSVAAGCTTLVPGAMTRAVDAAVPAVAASAGAAVGSTATSSVTPRLSPVTAAMSRARADAVRVPRVEARRTAEWCSPN